MKTLKNTIAVVALATLLLSSNLFAQDTKSATADVNLKIYQGLSFGAIDNTIDFEDYAAAGDLGETVSVTPGSTNGANFEVIGEATAAITISFDETVTLTSGVNTLVFNTQLDVSEDNSTVNIGEASVSTGHSTDLSLSGKTYLWVGGNIVIPSGSVAGDYNGTFNFTVAY